MDHIDSAYQLFHENYRRFYNTSISETQDHSIKGDTLPQTVDSEKSEADDTTYCLANQE